MSKKLFVGGLSWNTDNQGLLQAFSKFGQVLEAQVILDRETGRSRGFGFVTFAEEAAATEARNSMNGQNLDGRTIKVDVANERPAGGGFGGGGRGHGGGRRERW